MWPLSGIFLPPHCLSFSNRGSEICRTDFIWTEPERERFFEVLQSSFCLSQILCYEADKSQILVRNASLKGPQSAFSIFKHEGDILNKGISLNTLNIQYLIKIFKPTPIFLWECSRVIIKMNNPNIFTLLMIVCNQKMYEILNVWGIYMYEYWTNYLLLSSMKGVTLNVENQRKWSLIYILVKVALLEWRLQISLDWRLNCTLIKQ